VSERYDKEERSRRETEERQRLGPSIDAEGRRMDEPRGGDGPRPAREVRAERESHGRSRGESREERGQQERQRGRSDNQNADAERGTSWLSVILGWLAALGAGLILSGIVGAIVGAILGAGGPIPLLLREERRASSGS
jgi:hypothetical protein